MASKASKSPKTPPMFGTPTLRDRGWTEGLISRFLPDPDLLAVNPHYRSGPPRKLYDPAKVEAIEASDAWRIARDKARRRQSAASKAVATKQADMRRKLDRLTITVERLDRSSLTDRAIASYNNRLLDRACNRGWDDVRLASRESNPLFLSRIAVNFVRHHLTSYDEHLDDARGKVGASLAWEDVSVKVFAAIAEAYPWLAAECGRQAGRRGSRP